jgi:hypothetical protein
MCCAQGFSILGTLENAKDWPAAAPALLVWRLSPSFWYSKRVAPTWLLRMLVMDGLSGHGILNADRLMFSPFAILLHARNGAQDAFFYYVSTWRHFL